MINLSFFRISAKISRTTPLEIVALALILAAVIWLIK